MSTSRPNVKTWNTHFLRGLQPEQNHALIILNQPFSRSLFDRLWASTTWRCCADGGANRLYDILGNHGDRERHLPDLIKGDMDSIRRDVVQYYQNLGVPVIRDSDQDSTDLMKCVSSLEEVETQGGKQYDIILLGGLTGRLDQTAHVLSYLQKLRKERDKVFAVTDENVGWVLDEVSAKKILSPHDLIGMKGEHEIEIDHNLLGQTCGLLPVGVDFSILSTRGLRWNLSDQESSFDGLLSTSNHLLPGHNVWVKTSKVIWWTAELKNI